MTAPPHRRVRFTVQTPRSWLGRAAFVLAVVALAALAFFFLVVFLVAGAVLAAVFLVRWWWLARKVRRAQTGGAIEGEYRVVDPGDDAPHTARRTRALRRNDDPQ